MAVEDGTTAAFMHAHIDAINQRESERRKTEGIRLTLLVLMLLAVHQFSSFSPGVSQRVMKSRAHRERSHTQQENELETNARLARNAIAAGTTSNATIVGEEDEKTAATTSSGQDKKANDKTATDGATSKR